MNPQTMSLLGIAISSLCTILVALIQKNANQRGKLEDEREKRRRKEARLSMELMSASVELADVSAIALQNGKLNGNVEAAREKARRAQESYRQFLADVTSEVL